MGDRARTDADHVKFYFQRPIYLPTASRRSCVSMMAANVKNTDMITKFAAKRMLGLWKERLIYG